MSAKDHVEPAGGSRPAADDGPFTLTVDGETFTVRRRPDGGCAYDWDSGPNEGYGFSSGRTRVVGDPDAVVPPHTVDEHRVSIRGFLSMINPETGYIGD
ncbi:hypothetical protein BTZ20_3354 [Rhodococcus sp. MTM3W5.2]|uniref:hypothetical protein n=1 Tax=Rhodococcus sp. MTM3W5.2 TaxID=1805827 RepID=UPI0009795C24|nr:hypothetical protein [Rhodococcus sp. MTM3W5.2]AQA26144.1 hypothetical protein BTZ20_3354 [Rhodococcus sp. MTM3W5.2]